MFPASALGSVCRVALLALLAVVAVLALPALPDSVSTRVAGQAPVTDEESLPEAVADEIVAFLNAPGTILIDGGGTVPAGGTLQGDVAVLEGSLVLDGTVEGRLVVVNGDLQLGSEARVTGDATVTGGTVEAEDPVQTEAAVEGVLAVYAERLRYARTAGRFERIEPGIREDEGLSLGFGRSRFTIRAGTNYNRVEGLPVMFGPIVETASTNPLRLEALAVWRTDDGFDLESENFGYRVTLEQYLGGRELFSIGATAHSLVRPLEDWTLTDLESSLATFLFHKDYRDYVERVGWSAFARFQSPNLPLSFELGFVDEDHHFLPVGSPWALKGNDDPWRPQPLVGTGELQFLRGMVTFDTRNDQENPSHGWWITAETQVGVGGDLVIPGSFTPFPIDPGDPDPVVVAPARPADETFVAGLVDARRYNRVGPDSELVLRTVLGGALTGDPLPPQFQHALGGEGSMPGFRLFSLDCGARGQPVGLPPGGGADAMAVFPAYGCDRIALFQAEFRTDLGFAIDLGDLAGGDGSGGGGGALGWDSGLELRPRVAAFFNAGRGWSLSDGPSGPLGLFERPDESAHVDAGIGLLIRDLGIYLALPLSGDGRDLNFFLRLDHRF